MKTIAGVIDHNRLPLTIEWLSDYGSCYNCL